MGRQSPALEGVFGKASDTFERRCRAIERNLFLLCPNNSGSTFPSQALGRCRRAWSLAREGQHMMGFAGPSTMRTKWPLIWGATAESRMHFANLAAYDWERTKRAWYLQATAQSESAVLFVTKSPPFLMLADELRRHFAGTRFLIMVRNPYAAVEGIVRRRRRSASTDRDNLAEIAARHLLFCLERQKENAERHHDIALSFTYEQMCGDPAGISHRIVEFLPQLSDLDLERRQLVKQTYDEPLRNMNDEQIARLSEADISQASVVFAERRDLLDHFGYELI
jgi:hypothetical protein